MPAPVRQGGQGRGVRIATTSDTGHWFRNDRVFARSAVQVRRRGEGTPPYGTVCRGGRLCPPVLDNATPCRAGPVCPAGCGKKSGRAVEDAGPYGGLQAGAVCRADVGIGPYESATRGAMGGRPRESPLRWGLYGATKIFLFSCKFILEKQLGICYTLHYSGNKFLSA